MFGFWNNNSDPDPDDDAHRRALHQVTDSLTALASTMEDRRFAYDDCQ